MPAATPFAGLHDYCRQENIGFSWTDDIVNDDQTKPVWATTITVQPTGPVEAYVITGPKELQKKLARNLAAEIAIRDLGLSDVIIPNTST
ncbi:hypothetical protein FRB94_002920 [Tulasnella sp. JGI-2019a]|nr:hypothetical protein FRB93_013940 [Tulasnella sp. JGI-2019a]KAG9013392.1 hypothetical protein FRB94_002920 [Tulasnella sp. JGI-2019a]KAG9033741.1 hypothetical protein FRB95_014428 [Tulasnella sp. JGI-2019a]